MQYNGVADKLKLNVIMPNKNEVIAVKGQNIYQCGRYHTGKSVQYFFTAEQKGVKT